MFGKNKDTSKESSNEKPSGQGIKGQKWEKKSNVSDIGKTVKPESHNIGKTVAIDIGKTVAVDIAKKATSMAISKIEAPKNTTNLLPEKVTSTPVSNIAGYLPAKVKKYNR